MEILFEDIPLFYFVIQIIGFSILLRRCQDKSIITPSILIPSILVFYPIIGLLNLKANQIGLGWYKNVTPYDVYAVTSISNILLFLPLYTNKVNNIVSIDKTEFDYSKMWNWIKWGTLFGLTLNMLNFYSIGGIPIFWSNLSGFERFELSEKIFYPRFFYINSALITFNLIYWDRTKSNQIANIILLIINGIVAFAIGSRHLIFLPLMIGAIFIGLTKNISNLKIVFSLVLLAMVIFLTQMLRGDRYSIEFFSFLFSFGGEYRDFILLRDYFQFSEFQYGKTILPIVTNILPKQIYMLFDIDKKELAIYSAYIAQEIWGATTGIRTGIWGEFFMNYGDFGVLIGFFLFGLFTSKLEKSIYKYRNVDVKILLLSFLYTLFLFSIIGSWATIGDTLQSYGFIYLIFASIMKKSTQ